MVDPVHFFRAVDLPVHIGWDFEFTSVMEKFTARISHAIVRSAGDPRHVYDIKLLDVSIYLEGDSLPVRNATHDVWLTSPIFLSAMKSKLMGMYMEYLDSIEALHHQQEQINA